MPFSPTISGQCEHCGAWHSFGVCPRVKAIEYHPNGTVKRVEYHTGEVRVAFFGREEAPPAPKLLFGSEERPAFYQTK